MNHDMAKLLKQLGAIVLLFLGSVNAFAESPATTETTTLGLSSTWWMTVGVLFLISFVLILILLSAVVIDFARYTRKQMLADGDEIPWVINLFGMFDGDYNSLTGTYNDTVIEHHDYDGIQEYDNDLPPWWKYMFYISVVSGICYFVYYHALDGPSSTDEYNAEMAQAELMYANVDLNYDEAIKNMDELVDAEKSFKKTCKACHGENGEGKVGPNLTDPYWLHGGDINSVYKTIKYGVPERGMESWKDEFSNEEIYKLASYIELLQGSNPTNAKDPQGELYEAE